MADYYRSVTSMSKYDSIIIGSGHNGLIAANYLADAGKKVLVLERRSVVGGATVTEEFAPGFHASPDFSIRRFSKISSYITGGYIFIRPMLGPLIFFAMEDLYLFTMT